MIILPLQLPLVRPTPPGEAGLPGDEGDAAGLGHGGQQQAPGVRGEGEAGHQPRVGVQPDLGAVNELSRQSQLA